MFLTLLSQLKSHTWKVRTYLVLANGKQMFLKLEDDSHKHDGFNNVDQHNHMVFIIEGVEVLEIECGEEYGI
jgi:hypothetical protein